MSCIVALSLTPMMASKLFARGIVHGRVTRVIDAALRWLSARYDRSLQRTMRQRRLVLGVCAAICVLSYIVFQQLPTEYTPSEVAVRSTSM